MYGLSAIMLDSHTAQQLRSHVAKQLRIVARSSAHLTHEPTHDFLQRLQQPDVITTLQRATLQRLTQAQQYLHQAQSKKSYRHPELMLHATNGQPACRHGGKRFASWRSFAGHFVQSACPVLHHVDTTIAVADPAHGALAPGISKPAASSSGEAHCTEPQPLFEQPDLQALATEKKLQPLADAIRVELLAGHCPVCRYKCNDKAYITRHACLQHDFIKQAEPLVRSWARNHSGVGKPCKWCRQTFPQTSQVHQRSCIVLWALGHFLHRFSSLNLAGQQQLSNHGRGTSTRGGGTHTIRGLCEAESLPTAPGILPNSLTSLEPHRDDRSDDGPAPSGSSGAEPHGHAALSQAGHHCGPGEHRASGGRRGSSTQVLQSSRAGQHSPTHSGNFLSASNRARASSTSARNPVRSRRQNRPTGPGQGPRQTLDLFFRRTQPRSKQLVEEGSGPQRPPDPGPGAGEDEGASPGDESPGFAPVRLPELSSAR